MLLSQFLFITLIIVSVDVLDMSRSCAIHTHHEMHAQWVWFFKVVQIQLSITFSCLAFCKGCVDARLSTRQRKCPACNIPFGASDVHTFFFQWQTCCMM
jgi:hypothetical protein